MSLRIKKSEQETEKIYTYKKSMKEMWVCKNKYFTAMSLNQVQIFFKDSAYSLICKICILSLSCLYKLNSVISLYYKLYYINSIKMGLLPGFRDLFTMVWSHLKEMTINFKLLEEA